MGNIVVFEVNEHTNMMEIDTMVIYESFNYVNWYHNTTEYTLKFSCLNSNKMYDNILDLLTQSNGSEISSDVIAIGSVEFTEKLMNKTIRAINIPLELMDYKYTGRYVEYINKEELYTKVTKYNKLFIKGSAGCKKYEPFIYKIGDNVNLPDKLLVSEVINILAEYRAFVFRGKVIDCKQYIGKYTNTFDNKQLEKMIDNWVTKPSAFTLDIGVLENGKTVIIEAHNFLCCGLYGFDNPDKIVYMTLAAYREETCRKVGGNNEKES